MADEELVFDSGHVAKIKMRVKYSDYKQGKSEVRILDDDAEVQEEPKPTTTLKPSPTPTPKKP
jgi:hypothetical protein